MTKNLNEIVLARGTHASPEDGVCLMEAAAYLAGHLHTDADREVCPTIGAMARGLNDCMDDKSRQQLKMFCGRLIGTNSGRDLSRRRSYMALDWLVREYLPTWLDLVPALAGHAMALRTTAPIVATAPVESVRLVLAAARAAAWDAARDAARAAARDAAWDAARDAAGDAAGDAARAAARDAARAAAGAAARAAAWAAAGAAAGDAWAAAWAAAGAAAGDAARDAARERLQPTVQHLQGSAIQLLDSMIEAI